LFLNTPHTRLNSRPSRETIFLNTRQIDAILFLARIFVEDADDYVVLPLLARIGAEVEATDTITPWLLFELGPSMAFGDFGTEAEFAFRIWVGSAFR
jgi:hypothetical protein